MRINFILPPDSLCGGIRVIATYARKLAARGHQVTVVHPRHPRPTFREVLRSIKRHGHFPKAPDSGPSYLDDGIAPAERTANSKRFVRVRVPHAGPITARDVPDGDVVIATWWETAEWVWALPASKGMKAHFMQDYEIWGAPMVRKGRGRDGNGPDVTRVDDSCRLAIPKIVIAKWVANLLSTRFGQEPVALVPNSVDTGLFHASPRGKQKVPTVGFTYTPFRNKGTDVSIRAIELARKQVAKLKVIAFGAQSPTRDLPLPAGTEFFHCVPDRELPTIYAACDAWLFGTRIEGFGLPILEAMACRTPVIGTPAGAAPELLSHGGGRLVAMEDSQAMADALCGVLGLTESAWREMSQHAHQTAHSYSWEDATDRFEAALCQISGMPRAARVGMTPAA